MRMIFKGGTGLAAAVILTGAGGLWRQQSGSSAEPVPEGELMIHALGYVDVEPGIVRLGLARPGRVTDVPVREGQEVEAGAVLVRLDHASAGAKLREAEAALAEATRAWEAAKQGPARHEALVAAQTAAIDAARVRLRGAEREAKTLADHSSKGNVDKETAASAADRAAGERVAVRAEEARLTALTAADPSLEVARAEAAVGVRRAQVDQAREELAQHVLKAPARGTVLRVFARTGEAAGGQPLVVFCPAGPRVVRVELEAEVAGSVRAGCRAVLMEDGGAGRTWAGTVTRVADWYAPRRAQGHDALPFNDQRTLECVIEPDGNPLLRLNTAVRVRLAAARP